MPKLYRAYLPVLVLLMLCVQQSYAQKLLVAQAKQQELQVLSNQLKTVFETNHQAAIGLARRNNWPANRLKRNGTVIRLQGVNGLGFPVYLKTDNNTTAAATTNTNTVQPGGVLGLNLSGSSTLLNNKLGIWDGGEVLNAHQEFAGKTITLHDTRYGVVEHTTHVAGTMLAKGVYAPAKGMAFGATTLASYDFDNDVAEMTAAASGLLLSNHSYGSVAGWSFNDAQNRWEWYGLPGDTEDYTFGYYDTRAQAWDKIAYSAPYYLIVASAGNSHGETGPAVGEDYYGFKSRADQTFVDKGARPASISSNNAYDVISSTSNAKNILTVGAVNPLPFGPVNNQDVTVAYFSSWGPTDDGRVKPDICGMGVNVLSTGSGSNTDYVTLSGTSMSSPNVTGSLYLLQEYYAQKNAGNFMRSATLKALACHTAFDAGKVGPDYIYGWGLLDMKKAAQAITDKGTKSMITENTLSQGQTQTYNVIASGNGAVSATIAWTDPQGTPSAEGTLNDRTPKLVNDLDIKISDGATTYNPWVLDPANPSLAATTGNNIRDNVEQVNISNAKPGKTYTITISYKGTLQSGSQAYSLIATGIGGAAYCASAPASSADSRIDNFTFSNINNTPAAGCTSYSDYTNITATLEQGKTYPLSITLGTCGNNFDKIAKVYIDYNADGIFDPVTELAATTGVINSTGKYTADVNVPVSVVPDTYSLMRVVLVEAGNVSVITPCGTYAKGETQDYRVQFIKTSIDAGITSIANSNPGGTCAGSNNLTVRLKNYGRAAISNIPVTVTITNPDNSVITLNETYPGALAPNAEDDFTLTGTFNTTAGATYHITATSSLTGDQITSNNQASVNIVTATPPVANSLQAYYCGDTGQYLLNGASDGSILWYKGLNDTTPVAAGGSTFTSQAPVNNTFYAGVNDLDITVGPANKSVFPAGGYNQFTTDVYVTTAVPAVIETARLYIGNSGQITFNVSNAQGEIVSTSTINAIATRTIPGAGAQVNDPNDEGHIYRLNLQFPAAGTYTISIAYDTKATIYRNNGGVKGYPFGVPDIFTISGNSASPLAGIVDTAYARTFYYYFYNMQVKSIGCAATARQAVALTKPVITQVGQILSSGAASSNQWYYNDKPITGATGQTYTPTQSGNFKVAMTLTTGCTIFSDEYWFGVLALHPDRSDIGLAVFPVPTTGLLNVAFKAKTDAYLTLSLVNNAGQIIYSQQQAIKAGSFSALLDVSRHTTGTYVLKITLGSKSYGRKIIIAH